MGFQGHSPSKPSMSYLNFIIHSWLVEDPLVRILDRRLGLTAAHIDVAGSYTPTASSGNLGTEMTSLGHKLQTGLAKLSDSPAIYHRVENRF